MTSTASQHLVFLFKNNLLITSAIGILFFTGLIVIPAIVLIRHKKSKNMALLIHNSEKLYLDDRASIFKSSNIESQSIKATKRVEKSADIPYPTLNPNVPIMINNQFDTLPGYIPLKDMRDITITSNNISRDNLLPTSSSFTSLADETDSPINFMVNLKQKPAKSFKPLDKVLEDFKQ
ncbi:hypothetical protein ROZALSC1DRAFT_21806, partial [Rozella allomycis CSF55]